MMQPGPRPMTGKKKPDSGYRAFADEQQMAYYTVDADTMSARLRWTQRRTTVGRRSKETPATEGARDEGPGPLGAAGELSPGGPLRQCFPAVPCSGCE